MGVFAKGPQQEQQPGGGDAGLAMDLDLRACPSCRRELHPWEAVCPVDGAAAVARTALTSTALPRPPAHLLDDDADDAAADDGPAAAG
jgi:hypothetical protein